MNGEIHRLRVSGCGNSQSCRTLSNKSSECPLIETALYTNYMGSRTRVLKIGQNVAHYFHTPVCTVHVVLTLLFLFI